MARKKTILFLAQISPLIHGQAMMSAQLAALINQWSDTRLITINTCYAQQRSELGGFSLLKFWRWLWFLMRAFWHCVTGSVDTMVMTHSFFRGPFIKDSAFLWLGRLMNKTLVVWVHMDPNRLEMNQAPAWFAAYARRVLTLPDYWVACAPSLPKQWPKEFEHEKIRSICNGIEDVSQKFERPKLDCLHVAYLSAMTEEKGWRDLFAVAESLCAKFANIVFDFYGGPGAGESEESLREAFANVSNPSRILWHGGVYDEAKSQVLSQADVFCLPSWTEAFPLAVLEAMSYGVPVIATQVGGIPDAVQDGINGWLYPARDREALENIIVEAILDPEKLKIMGKKNRLDFTQKFSLAEFDRSWKNFLVNI